MKLTILLSEMKKINKLLDIKNLSQTGFFCTISKNKI